MISNDKYLWLIEESIRAVAGWNEGRLSEEDILLEFDRLQDVIIDEPEYPEKDYRSLVQEIIVNLNMTYNQGIKRKHAPGFLEVLELARSGDSESSISGWSLLHRILDE
ncbi:MAG: hypothetical protein HRU10_15235 [Opitutales bacterium]|nr:hypothetical protein [Opitutales bacterium]